VTSLAVMFLADNILAIDGSFLLIFISIILLIFILNATLFRPINNILAEREKMGGGASNEAKQLIKEYDKKVMMYEDGIRNARLEAFKFTEAQRHEALAEREDFIFQAKTEMAAHIESAKQEVLNQSTEARTKLANDARQMAASITSNLLRRPVNAPGGLGL
jgi:F-type H+-transporting ATPase subunit b